MDGDRSFDSMMEGRPRPALHPCKCGAPSVDATLPTATGPRYMIDTPGWHIVWCDECGARGDWELNDAQAAKSWNRTRPWG